MKALLVATVISLVSAARVSVAQEGIVLSLRDAERIALENHPAAHAAEAALGVSKGRFWQGISPPAPSLTLDYSYVPLGRPLSAFGEKTLEISQSLDFPLTTVTRSVGLSREVNAQESDLAAARLAVAAGAKLAYVQTLAAEQHHALAKENLAIADSFFRGARIRRNVGEATQLELLTAQVQRTQAVNDLETAHAAVLTARSELRNALGWPPDRPVLSLVLSDSLTYKPLSLALDSLQSTAQRSNPQIGADEERLGAAEAERTAAWMSVLPSLSLSYFRQTVGDNPNLYGVRFGISVPVWFLLENRGYVQEASAGVAIARENLRSVRSTVSLEVTSAFAAYANSKRRVELQQQELLPQAAEIFRVANVSYQAGEASYVEFLQALQALNAARNASLDALVEYNSAVIRLERVLGRSL